MSCLEAGRSRIATDGIRANGEEMRMIRALGTSQTAQRTQRDAVGRARSLAAGMAFPHTSHTP